jgi:ubiquinol-cytochrome c reductase cytochrome c1 subunit
MSLKKTTAFIVFIAFISSVSASNVEKPQEAEWPFEGIFGYFDKQAIQRGFKVFKEVCSACHSIKYLEYGHLTKVGFSEAEVKTIAGEYNVQDGPNDQGDMFERPARITDYFHSPFPNEQAARAANNGAHPPDLSLIVKAREDGANYIHSLLTGYQDPPEGVEVPDGMHYNPYFPNHNIAMTPPLTAGAVEYTDGTEDSIDQMSKDVVMFLQWVGEPKMEERKILGIKVMLYLFIFTIVFYLAKKKIWSDVK